MTYREAVEAHGSVSEAARQLNLTRASMRRRLEKEAEGGVAPPGYRVKGETIHTGPDGVVRNRWTRTTEDNNAGFVEGLKEAFKEFKGASRSHSYPINLRSDLLTVYMLPDLHFGQYSWAAETGADYDTEITTGIALQCMDDLVHQSQPSKKAIILGLGDYFHANDQTNETPGHHNRVDVDTRWARVYRHGAKLAVNLVDMAAKKHEEVEPVFLPGNHDLDAAMSLTVALGLYYSNNPRIHVHEEPGIAWYHRFGKVLLGATHGHTMKPEQMAMMLATDRSQDWGETLFRYFYFGHIHRQTSIEVGPVMVESFNSPAAKDAWSAGKGFRSGRSMTAITHHRENGEMGRHKVNIV